MKIYVPLIVYEIDAEDEDVCDFMLQGFTTEEDAKMIYPDAQIIEIETEPNIYMN